MRGITLTRALRFALALLKRHKGRMGSIETTRKVLLRCSELVKTWITTWSFPAATLCLRNGDSITSIRAHLGANEEYGTIY